MRKLALLALLVCALTAAASVAGATSARKQIPVSGTVWAVERFDGGPNTLAAFDASTGDVVGVWAVGRRPIGVTAPRGTGKVYTADERSNQLTVVSKKDLSIVTHIPIGPFPHHMMASPNGKFIYVGEYGTNKVGVVDTTLDERVAEYTASTNPGAKTHAVWITNDGKNLYATNEGSVQADTGTLSKLDAVTGTRLWEIPTGHRPSEVLVTPNGKTAYVSIRNDNAVKVYDVSGETPVLTGETFIGVQPDTLQITNDGKTLVVGLRSVPQMALMDTATLHVRWVSLADYGISGHEWLSANGKYTFIALESKTVGDPGAIGVVDNASAETLAIWQYPGGPWPHGVFYEPETLR
jgi:DNA-binding beta-propeller fold protein YncE